MVTPTGKAPALGRIVHYHTPEGVCAALVSGVYGEPWDMVDVVVFHRPRVSRSNVEEVAKVTAHRYVRMGTALGEWSWPVLV